MKPYSQDLRERIVADLQSRAYTQSEVAEKYAVSLSFVEKLWRRQRATGQCAALAHAGGGVRVLARFESWLRASVARQPDVPLAELRARLRKRKRHVTVSVSMLCREFQRLGLPRKKKALYDSQRDTPRVQNLRRTYWRRVARAMASKFRFLDESGLHLGMTSLYGRAAPGERVVESTPDYSGPHYTIIATLSLQGIQAPLIFKGALTGDIFEAYVCVQLLPTLKPGDVVVLDNLSAHKRAHVSTLIEACGARLLFLSPYSADFNPIELCWAKVKQALRVAKARSLAKLVEALADALRAVTPQDALAWFQHCGYAVH